MLRHSKHGGLLSLTYLTHPDYATLVDPLCCAKRVKKKIKIPLSAQRREGGRAKQ